MVVVVGLYSVVVEVRVKLVTRTDVLHSVTVLITHTSFGVVLFLFL